MTDPQQPQAGENASASPPGNRVALLAGALALAFVLLGTGAVFAGIAVGRSGNSANSPSGTSSSAPHRDVASDQAAVAHIPTCSIANPVSASALQKAYVSVVDVKSGKSVYAADDTSAQSPAGVQKVLTAAAAVAVFGGNYRIATHVVDGVQPGSITLVGAGDATLSRNPAGQSFYTGAPTLAALAAATLTTYNAAHPGVPITNIVVDASLWDPNDNWLTSWPRTLQTGGQLSEVTALQVDGDRADPKVQISPRSADPVTAAGKAFAVALGVPDATVTPGQAENGATPLGIVRSQPVKSLVKQMLLTNDDTLAEMLARLVSVKENLGGTSASLQNAITTALTKFGIDTGGLTVYDGSGESNQDLVPAAYTAKLLSLVMLNQDALQYVGAGLSISGQTGGLVGRFTGANVTAVGKVHAKTGTLPSTAVLAGYLTAADGTNLAFSISGIGAGITPSAAAALDTLATAIYVCGKNLTTH